MPTADGERRRPVVGLKAASRRVSPRPIRRHPAIRSGPSAFAVDRLQDIKKNGARVGLEHEDLRVGRHEDLHRARSDVAADVQIDPALYSYGRI